MSDILDSMTFTIRMDREIDKNKHYLSPGGYELNQIPFDFRSYSGKISDENPNTIEMDVLDLDTSAFPEAANLTYDVVNEYMQSKKGFSEFYIYTGESNEPDIFPEKLESLGMHFSNGGTITVPLEIRQQIEQLWRMERTA